MISPSFSILYPDFRKFMPRWFADKLHWGAERSQGCSSFKNKLLFWVREEYFNCSLSVENIKEPILMEDVKVTESRIMQESNVFNYEKNVVQRLPCSTAQQIICLHKRRHLSRCKSCSCQLARLISKHFYVSLVLFLLLLALFQIIMWYVIYNGLYNFVLSG